MSLDLKTPSDVVKYDDIGFVDLRFTDPRGKWQHLTMVSSFIEEETFEDGVMFDGSSIAGWKAINESDMALIPDASTAVMDPFAAQPMLILNCDIIEPTNGQPYERDPRSVAKKAEAYLGSKALTASPLKKVRTSRAPSSKKATWHTVQASKAATSRSRRSTKHMTFVPRWSP